MCSVETQEFISKHLTPGTTVEDSKFTKCSAARRDRRFKEDLLGLERLRDASVTEPD